MINLFRYIFWSLFILIWGANFSAMIITETQGDTKLNFIMGAIAGALIMIFTGFFTYRKSKAMGSEIPLIIALIVCSVLGVILAIAAFVATNIL